MRALLRGAATLLRSCATAPVLPRSCCSACVVVPVIACPCHCMAASQDPAGFLTSITLVELTLPQLMTWEEFLQRLSEIKWWEWLILASLISFGCSLCGCSIRRDDREVVTDFHPDWYVSMTKLGPYAAKAVGHRMAMIMTTHKLLSPFFVLPDDSRAKFTHYEVVQPIPKPFVYAALPPCQICLLPLLYAANPSSPITATSASPRPHCAPSKLLHPSILTIAFATPNPPISHLVLPHSHPAPIHIHPHVRTIPPSPTQPAADPIPASLLHITAMHCDHVHCSR